MTPNGEPDTIDERVLERLGRLHLTTTRET
jgi:hypothetical protein